MHHLIKGERVNNNFKISLAAARTNAQLSQQEVAKLMKISKTTLVNWEKGRSFPNIRQCRQLSELYKIPLNNINF